MAEKRTINHDIETNSIEKPKKRYEYERRSFVIGKKPDGKPDRVWVRGKTPEEADENLREAKRRHGLGLNLGDMTVREWSKIWMEVYKANAGTQRAHYQSKLDLDILPAIGNMAMRDVRASHLKRLLNSYEGGKKDTVTKIRVAIKQLFYDAEHEGVIERNPSTRLELPELEEKARRPLTCIERELVLQVAKEHPRGPYVMTLYGTGIRRGECIALTPADIDLKKKQISITKSVVYNGNAGAISTTKAKKLRKKRVKSDDDGSRIVPIPKIILPILTELCRGKKPGDLLFPADGGGIISKASVLRWWGSFKRACHIKAGAKMYRQALFLETSVFNDEVTPHYLRHNYATDLSAAGVDKDVRAAILGHARIEITDHYTKITDDVLARAAKKLNRHYKKRSWCDLECIDALPAWFDDAEERAKCDNNFGTYLAHVFDLERFTES
jgi:integrase